MVAGADVVRYVLSSGGVVVVFAILAVWLAISPSSRRARITIIAVALFLFVFSSYGVEFAIGRALVGSLRPFQSSDVVPGRRTVVVILGSGSRDAQDWDERMFSRVDDDAAGRVLEATRIYRLIDPAVVISSAGNPHPRRKTAPSGQTMRDALITLGIPPDRIVVETISRTTRDEAVVVEAMLREQGAEQVVLVTSETHMRRSLGAFRAVGVTAIPAIAYEFERKLPLIELIAPTKDGLTAASQNAHELLGIFYYRLRGWYK